MTVFLIMISSLFTGFLIDNCQERYWSKRLVALAVIVMWAITGAFAIAELLN